MSSSKFPGFLATMRDAFKILFNKSETPRKILERNELYMAILASTHRALRAERAAVPDRGWTGSIEQVEAAIEESADRLADMGADTMSLVGLRYELQNLLGPEIVRALEAFRAVDGRVLAADGGGGGGADVAHAAGEDTFLRSILLDEYGRVRADLDSGGGPKKGRGGDFEAVSDVPSPAPFLATKRGALRTVLASKGWLDEDDDDGIDILSQDADKISNDGTSAQSMPDDFGYYADRADAEVNAAIRHHQMINLARAALLREDLGYSVLALRSTIPGAGRGVFVDGAAMAGSLLAFFPGEVWPKEYLTNDTINESLFKDDDNYQLSIRFDDILVDSRKAPYTVLNGEHSNPFAIAHIANHPPRGGKPNCRTVALNFTERMGLEEAGLARYVPNTYARDPMIIGPKAPSRDVIFMHGFGLVAARDVSNEELMYDYRLSPGPNGIYPSWYSVCDEEESHKRWWQEQSNEGAAGMR